MQESINKNNNNYYSNSTLHCQFPAKSNLCQNRNFKYENSLNSNEVDMKMRRRSTMETNAKKLIKIQARKNRNSVYLSGGKITKYFVLRMPRYIQKVKCIIAIKIVTFMLTLLLFYRMEVI